VIGFIIGIGRLSSNWLIARICGGYVEVIRNLPHLFQILFWYLAVLATLPPPRQSFSIFGEVLINNRGVVIPRPIFGEGAAYVGAAAAIGVAATFVLRRIERRRQLATGRSPHVLWPGVALILGLPLLIAAVLGFPIAVEKPELRGFNFIGGLPL